MEKRNSHSLSVLHPTAPKIWSGRPAETIEYVYQQVHCVDIQKTPFPKTPHTALIGFACDAGVERNSGRTGAAKGPDSIRKQLASLAIHNSQQKILDLGNIVCQNGDLETAQEALSAVIRQVVQHNHFPIVIGGGHELAYGSFCGLEDLTQKETIGIINFDAHFDLRQNPIRNSGTPFYDIHSYLQERGLEFHYLALGIREAANTPSLFETAQKLHVKWMSAEQLIYEKRETLLHKIDAFLAKVDGVYLTIDMDGFDASVAPGVSAPNPYGYAPSHFSRFLSMYSVPKKFG